MPGRRSGCGGGWRAAALLLLLLPAAAAATADSSAAPGAAFFEDFGPGWEQRWTYSSGKKYTGRFASVQPVGFQDPAIEMPQANAHYGLAAPLAAPLAPAGGLVVQYEAKFSRGHSCGGAYLKLLSQPRGGGGLNPAKLGRKTPFTLMFGPDRCGPDARVHVILHALNPATGNVTEHHLTSAPEPKEDALSHVYTLVLHPNHWFKLLIDGQQQLSGPLLSAKFEPPLQPPATIPDPEHVKPDDWVEEEMMDDPAAVKPPDWDNRREVPDPHATPPEGWLHTEQPEMIDPTDTQPADWDEASKGPWLPRLIPNPACAAAPGCGEWEAPKVPNPKYKGPWIPPQVPNPAYKGAWQQRMVPNPAHFDASAPLELLAPVAGVAFELWTTDAGYTFDSVLLGAGEPGLAAAAAYMRNVWRRRHDAEYAAAMRAARAAARPPGLRHLASNALQDLLEQEQLAGLRRALQPLLVAVRGMPELAWLLVTAPPLLALLAAVVCCASRGKAEEADEPEPELEVDEEEVKRLSKQAAALQRQRQAAGAGAGAARQEAPSEHAAQRQEREQEPEAAAGAAGSDSPPPATGRPRRRAAASRRA